VNMPEDVTVEDVEQIHIDAWRLGIKAVAIYRDNCKVAQPLSTGKTGKAVAGSLIEAGTHRRRLPRKRNSKTFAFKVDDCEGYITAGEYEDGQPGEVFIKVSKQGSTLAGVMDAFSISISLGLQHMVPLSTYVRKYTNMKFEPAGITDDAELRFATSIVDYMFRCLAIEYLSLEERRELGVLTTSERNEVPTPISTEQVDQLVDTSYGEHGVGDGMPALSPAVLTDTKVKDAPYCYSCGNEMQRAGSCYVCGSCGSTSGCS